MTKAKAIRKFCLDCTGDSRKDVAFCTDPICALWEHRLGADLRSIQGRKIMEANCRKYAKDFAELEEKYGVDPELYLPRTPRRIVPKTAYKPLLAPKLPQ